jgi:hypothetical protein
MRKQAMSNLDQIVTEIKETVTPLMSRWVEDRTTSILKLKEQVKAISEDSEFKSAYTKRKAFDRWLSQSEFKFYWFQRKGCTKGDYMLAVYESANDIRTKIEKEAANKLLKIDVAVKKKINFDVDTVEKLYFTEGKDGYFEGAWKLNNEKTFSFDTFYAGGYNIQCFHVRTKYKLK